MREAIGGTAIFQIVIFFILLFTGFMCLSINHSKAFNVKNMIINTIERVEKIDLTNTENDEAIKEIVGYLKKNSYRTTGNCPPNYTGINREGKVDAKNSAFCIKAENVAKNSSEFPEMNYYRVIVFYQLDLPIFRSLFEFQVSGDTKIMYRSTGYTKLPNGTFIEG